MDALIDRIRQRDRRSLARAMSLVDDSGPESRTLQDRLRQATGEVPWWGLTGPPGVGKSTLIDSLLGALRERGRRIGVVAVDPTSPMSDGALLGDRVRMMRHAVDPDIFIRSLATHRDEGGLSRATLHCARLLELGGFDPVLIETVGVGQNEVDIATVADICVVILGPGYGDEIQLIKAGLLEIADIVAINKCDLPGANRLLEEVRAELGHSPDAAAVELFAIEAKSGRGVSELLAKLLDLDEAARRPKARARRRWERVREEIRRGAHEVWKQVLERGLHGPDAEELVARFEAGEISLDDVVARLAAKTLTALQRRPGHG